MLINTLKKFIYIIKLIKMSEKKEPKNDDILKNYPTLKKFDEYYKDEKNLKKLNIFYKRPNVDKKDCQIDFDEFDQKYNLNKYAKKNNQENKNNFINSKVTKKYDFSKLSKDDLNYYLTLVNYYNEKIYGGNIFIKGVNGPIEKALELLKQCQYNTRLALAKILFPVKDRMGGLTEFENPSLIIPQAMDTRKNNNETHMEIEEKLDKKEKELKKNININNELINKQKKLKYSPSIYLSFALNDLIGADKVQKEKWLQYIIDQVNNKIEYKSLKTLIEIANKMKLELPDNIIKEISLSEDISNKIKKHLENKDQDLDELKDLFEITQTQKVQMEEFSNLKKIIDRGEIWQQNFNNIIGKCVEFKELESLYNEANNLPFEIDKEIYDQLDKRYNGALTWLELYSKLTKCSKNKSNKNYDNKNDDSLNILEKMIDTANNVLKFTSSEVKSLIKNYNYLNETEKEIKSTLYDPNKVITKEMLKDFLNKLNESKFTTELHDEIEDKLNIMEWRENILENINPNENVNFQNNENYLIEILEKRNKIILKNKVFKFLIKEAESKKLLDCRDVQYFVKNDELVTTWIEKIEPIFYNGKERDNISAKNLLTDLHNSENCMKFEEFLNNYQEGLKFKLINEECEDLLNKCNEIKELHDGIKLSLNENQSILNFNKLKSFGDKIAQYNIICDEFDNVLKQLYLGQEWLENSKKFFLEYNNANKNKFSLEYLKKEDENDIQQFIKIRSENIKLIEKYLKENKIFFDDLLKLTKNVPTYLKNTSENNDLTNYQNLAEFKMNSISELNNPENILLYIEESQGICISKDIIKNCFNSYKIKTWNQAIKYKLYLNQAESLLKEGETLQNIKTMEEINENINSSDLKDLNNKVNITKEWMNKTKQFLSKREKSFSELLNLSLESKDLPLLSNAIDEFINFKNIIENNINEIKKIKNEKKNFETIEQFYKNFNNNKFIDNEEYNFIKSLYEFGIKWTEHAKKIINSRQLCQLYFKNKVPLEDGTIIETKENVVDILANKEMDNINYKKDNLFEEDNNINNAMIKSQKFTLGENQSDDNNNNLINFLSKKRIHENSNSKNNSDEKEEKGDKEEKEIIKENDNKNIFIKEININNYMNIDENIDEKENIKKNKLIPPNLVDQIRNENENENQIEYHQSEKVKKYYLNQPLQKYECANLLSLINNKESLSLPQPVQSVSNSKQNYYTRSHSLQMNLNTKKTENINSQNSNLSNSQKSQILEEQQVTPEQIQKFISMDYYHRYMYLRSNLIFHDDTNEQYCICRKGDDSVNYMIICEKCKEWFHGKCLAMPKTVADNISNYYCLCCSRKYDLPKESYHKLFFEIKRVSLNDLILMIEEGKKANCYFDEIDVLEDIKIRSDIWNQKYYKLLDEVIEFYQKTNIYYLNEKIEKKLEVLYLESESLQIELSNFLHPITILKHNEWFKNVYRELYATKQNEESIKNLIKSSYWIFNLNEKNIDIPKLEKRYYEIIYQLAELKIEILSDIYKKFHQNEGEDNSISIKDKNKKK